MESGQVLCSAEHIATVPGHSIFDSFFALLSVDAQLIVSDNKSGFAF